MAKAKSATVRNGQTTAAKKIKNQTTETIPETVEEAIEIQAELTRDKYQQLIRDVVTGEADRRAVEAEFEKSFGSEWFAVWEGKSDEEFQAQVAQLHSRLIAEKTEVTGAAESKPSTGEYRLIVRPFIHPSSTNPRKDFDADDLTDLANSIRQHGIQQPIIVRPLAALVPALTNKLAELTAKKKSARSAMDEAQVFANENPGDASSKAFARLLEKYSNAEGALEGFVRRDLAGYGYELIAGERRWRASALAELDEIPCIVREVSDRIAFEIQIIENLQRKDIAPMQEAAGFKNLIDKGNFTIQEIALRVGKPPDFVHLRLKLNDLIEAGQKDVARGKLPIGHALEIAKYSPEIQKELLDDVFDYYGTPQTLARLQQTVERKVLTLLKHAPFSLKATNLRADGLACKDCPERSGAVPTLFDHPKPEQDACLNKQCFAAKTQLFIQIERQNLGAKTKTGNGGKSRLAPVIIDTYGTSKDYSDALNLDGYSKIHHKKDACASAETAFYVESSKFGQKQLICRDAACQTHYPKGATRAEEKDEKEAQKRFDRKEELFDYRTAKRVAPRVFREAMVKFDGVLFDDLPLLAELVVRLWKLQSSQDSQVMGIILEIVQEWTDKKVSGYYYDEDDRYKTVESLTVEQQFQFLFLLLNAYKGAMFYESYLSQKEVRAVAEKYDIDYKLLDAEERHALCIEPKSQYKKHAGTFKKYLDDVRAGKKVNLPRVYSPGYKAKD